MPTLFITFFSACWFAIVFNSSETTLARGKRSRRRAMWKSAPESPVPFVDFAVRLGQYVKENDPLFTVSQDYGGKQGSVVQFDRRADSGEEAQRAAQSAPLRTGLRAVS